MSSSEAQKSPVHHATEDSDAEPTNVRRAPTGTPAGVAPADRGREDVAADAADLKSRPDTAMGVPGNFERGAATAAVRPDTDDDANPAGRDVIGGGPGAGDGSSGGGAGAGVPGGGTDMRTGGAFSGGDPDQDRQKLFPDQAGSRAGSQAAPGNTPPDAGPHVLRDDVAVGKDPDESTYGGPLKIDAPDAR